ncbi:uncharacterized protein ACRADG_007990 [Cochliomyia hominivorax]
MEDNYPEIALNQPKSDPRTVLLHKRNFMESSSDHIQEFYRNNSITKTSTTTTAYCDKSKNILKYTTTANVLKLSLKTQSASTISSTSLVLTKMPLSSISSSTSSSLSSTSTEASLQSSTTSSSTSLLSNILVKFSKSCHFINASFKNNNNNYLYKTSQKTKLVFFLLFVWCAILLQTTQALPVRRVSNSGRKLILHTNVYRERYHQKLLEEQRQHNLHQQQIQQLQLKQQKHHQQQQSLPTHFSLNLHHHQRSQPVQLQQQQQVQKNHIFSPGPKLRRHPQISANHRHHLHQRAAPSSLNKVSICNANAMYKHLHNQMNMSMSYIKQLCAHYLRERGNESYESMSETWNLISLETRNPDRKPVSVDNKMHREIVEFYKNLHNFIQLIDYASQDTNENKTVIEHGEEIQIDKIIKFLDRVKHEIKINMLETNKLMDAMGIEKPDLSDNTVEFNSNLGRRVRDFLIIKNLIEELQRVIEMVEMDCQNNDTA